MTTECHKDACKYHSCHTTPDNGPFCDEPECKEFKYRVHTYQVVRVDYEVEAGTPEQAAQMVYDRGDNESLEVAPIYRCSDPEDAEEWQPDMVVDPILPDGSVDYANVKTVTYPPQEDPKVQLAALKERVRELGAAIENGDPQHISDLWIFHVAPLVALPVVEEASL